jgi:hypothetical protein
MDVSVVRRFQSYGGFSRMEVAVVWRFQSNGDFSFMEGFSQMKLSVQK